MDEHDWPDDIDDCYAQTPGNCELQEVALLHDCSLVDGHDGHHQCACGRNWPDSENYRPVAG